MTEHEATEDNGGGEASLEMDVRGMGLDVEDSYDTEELSLDFLARPDLLRNTLLSRARAWVGREFQGRQEEQCATFVRQVLAEAGVFVPPSQKPFDYHLTRGLQQGPDFANSFFSAQNGSLLGYADLREGDLMAFRDTYEGKFPKGCITHVGICIGEDKMIDRSTSGEPVRILDLDEWWKERFVVGLRPRALCR